MNGSGFKALLHACLPPAVVALYRSHREWKWFEGNYEKWAEAERACGGYGDPSILDRVYAAAGAVRDGIAAYERDGCLFSSQNFHFPLMTALFISARRGERLRILDFGGSLGSAYYRHRSLLRQLIEFDWCVVDQPAVVALGRQEFQDGSLKFYSDLLSCCAEGKPDIIILSSVLQYLPNPHEQLDELIGCDADFVLLDLTPKIKGRDRLTVQRVPPQIYSGSYPAWFFNEAQLLHHFHGYHQLFQFPNADGEWLKLPGTTVDWQGILFARTNFNEGKNEKYGTREM